ncbi:MAG: hypothetical protein ISS71_01235 [Phycisphaerae bacterium]|nr:hypothetical protein [Phycisphaerae bacterium]
MDYQTITRQLLTLLAEHDVAIRKDAMGGGRGGLCSLNGQKIFMIDRDSSPLETAVSCAKAIGKTIQDTESIYLRPAIREFIDKYAEDG